ncbi:PEP-CTERM sorting domain-containing protein [Piscinibacter sp.]|uniref:PEP-CTERM sorting domain-containing protein n=1 Tax=Piscinibacter sp. TaxID=1903157 RepID=UPI002CD44136|nr:PEP-CTERM sorting domain-containing protein [Albitalea sp.]HUG22671.1 PEP-CTERM sorting domain-containing protein [Albitalea sp.]
MKKLIVAGAIFAATTAANAVVTLSGGTYVTFDGYDAPPVLTDVQTSGLENTVLSGGKDDQFTATFLGKEAAHKNEFWVNNTLVFNNLASAPTTYGPFTAGNPMVFSFRDAIDGEDVPNGGNPIVFASYVVFGTMDGDVFNPYTKNGEYDFVLGFNDGSVNDADYDDLVVGFNVTTVPEPETYALMLAGLGVVGFVARRRRAA